jgi:hypothetical protein
VARATFVLCIEQNALRAQALLLCESIRTCTGTLRQSPILAIVPRPGLGIVAQSRRRLEALDVSYVEAPLNTVCPEYGSANRVYAAAWAEVHADTDWIIANQAAAAIAFWSRTDRVRQYPRTYNVPLHTLIDRPQLLAAQAVEPLVHLHSHWTLTAPYLDAALRTLRQIEPRTDRIAWLAERLPLPL